MADGLMGDVQKEKKVKKTAQTQREPIYGAWEFINEARKLFGVSPDLVAAALKNRGITECTKAEAEKIVEAFVERKVK